MNSPTLSVKCSIYTKNNLKKLFDQNEHFIDLRNNQINTNVSWFFKHSAHIFLALLEDNPYTKDFKILSNPETAYDNQFADALDNSIKKLFTNRL